MKKVLFINCDEENIVSDSNKGAEAVAIATVNSLRQSIPDSNITSFLNYSLELADKLKIRVVRMKRSPHIPPFIHEAGWFFIMLGCLIWAGLNKYLHINCGFLIRGKRLHEYAKADIIIYVGMDYYSEDNGWRTVLRHSRDILLGILLKRPVVIWAISAGPFKSRLVKATVKLTLNRVNLITVRDSLSGDFLKETGVNPVLIHLTSDPAFLLPPADGKRMEELTSQIGLETGTRPIIGINPSHSFIVHSSEKGITAKSKGLRLMSILGSIVANLLPKSLFDPLLNHVKRTFLYNTVDSTYNDYKDFFAKLIEQMIEEFDATILLIAHDQAMAQLFDDRVVTNEIAAKVNQRDRVIVVGNGYNAEEIKGLIGKCDLFIGARFHATIAAISQGVPIVCFPYYHKFSLFANLGQERYICPSYTYDEALPRIREAWSKRKEIKKELEPLLKRAVNQASLNGELVKQVLTNASSSLKRE